MIQDSDSMSNRPGRQGNLARSPCYLSSTDYSQLNQGVLILRLNEADIAESIQIRVSLRQLLLGDFLPIALLLPTTFFLFSRLNHDLISPEQIFAVTLLGVVIGLVRARLLGTAVLYADATGVGYRNYRTAKFASWIEIAGYQVSDQVEFRARNKTKSYSKVSSASLSLPSRPI